MYRTPIWEVAGMMLLTLIIIVITKKTTNNVQDHNVAYTFGRNLIGEKNRIITIAGITVTMIKTMSIPLLHPNPRLRPSLNLHLLHLLPLLQNVLEILIQENPHLVLLDHRHIIHRRPHRHLVLLDRRHIIHRAI